MRRVAPAALRAAEHRGVVLCALGAATLVAGLLYEGASKDVVASGLILLGAGELAVGVLLPRLSELEIGPSGFKTKLSAAGGETRLEFTAEAAQLERVAWLLSGDAAIARRLVQDALAKTRRSDRGGVALRNVVDMAEIARDRQRLGALAGSPAGDAVAVTAEDRDVVDALARLDYRARAAYVLRVAWPLNVDEVSAVLKRPVDAVEADIDRAREQLMELGA